MEINDLTQIQLQNTDLLLLDLDNTLYEYERCHLYGLQKLTEAGEGIFKRSAAEIQQLYHDARKYINHLHLGAANAHSRLLYSQRLVEQVTGATDTGAILQLYDAYWNNYIAYMELYPEAVAFLNSCKSQGVITVMVTDMLAEIQFKKITALSVGEYFNYVVTSEEAGVEKPHPYIFEMAINKALKLNPGIKSIAVVGDNTKKDFYASDIYEVTVFHVVKNG